jgi:dolichol kinase
MSSNAMAGTVLGYQSEFQALSLEIVACLERCQRPKWRDPRWRQDFEVRLEQLSNRMQELRAQFESEIEPRIEASLRELNASLESYRSAIEQRRIALREFQTEMRSRAQALSQEYELFLLELKQAGLSNVSRAAHLKPLNPWRNLFHAFNGLFAAVLYVFVLNRETALWILVPMLVLAGLTELSRKIWPNWNDFLVDRVFGLVSRPKERHTVNSATWYLLALVLAVSVFPVPAVVTGLVVLAVADPVASLVGKRWGRTKIRGQKSLQGTLAFLGSALIAVSLYVVFAQFSGAWSFSALTTYALISALAGALAELWGDRLDDNFGILISVSLVATGVAFLLGGF